MSGNKPLKGLPKKFAAWSPFTARMAAHPKVAYFRYPDKSHNPDERLLVTMVIDQILVGDKAAADRDVRAALRTQGAVAVGQVFDGQEGPPGGNVAIWRLKAYADVAMAVWEVRKVLRRKKIGLEQVAPNHVLIPASNYHSCPWSPPKPHGNPGELAVVDRSVTVTVIDSGYQAESLIASRVEYTPGKWFAKKPGGYVWDVEPGDPLDHNNDGRLDALVGHANFVAGVVAQKCPRATIKVVNHNGAFVSRDSSKWPIPTEASVARSLWESRNSDVINVGFAFPTLPAIPPVDNHVTDGPASWALDLVIKSINREAVIVAPAGNQDSPTPQYPAAFHGSYSNVIGVGSVGPAGKRSSFSNHGPWVTCCTEGENVVSTFINSVRPWKTEDAEPPGYPNEKTHPTKDFNSGWASWSGTSFAAPKVAGAIAERKADDNVSPLEAWNRLKAGRPSPPALKMGVLISGLLG